MAEQYNRAIWPMQVIAYGLGLAAVILAVRKLRSGDQLISGILAFFWLWVGIAFHLLYFSPINPLAVGFGVLFILQGIIFVLVGIVTPRLTFHWERNAYATTGAVFLLYALVVYPVIGALLGRGYPESFAFGVAPCPTTIFTYGVLLLTTRRVPRYVLIIPLLWSITGVSAISLGVFEDIGMVIAGIVGTVLLWRPSHLTSASS